MRSFNVSGVPSLVGGIVRLSPGCAVLTFQQPARRGASIRQRRAAILTGFSIASDGRMSAGASLSPSVKNRHPMDAPGSTTSHATEVESGARFEFGKNWTRFLSVLDDERIDEACKSMRRMLGIQS